MSRIKTAMLLAALTALLVWAGHALGGPAGFAFALVLAGILNFAAFWWSDAMVLRIHGARAVTPADAPALHALVRDLARRGGVPMPRLYVIPERAPNAFATGRSPERAAVAVSE